MYYRSIFTGFHLVAFAAAGAALLLSPAAASPQTPPSGNLTPASARSLDLSRWDALAKIKDDAARRRSLMELLAGLQAGDYTQAADKLTALGYDGSSEEMKLLISAWCTVDTQAAADFAIGRGVPELIEVVARDWSGRDSAAAAKWALAIPSDQSTVMRDYALVRVLQPVIEKDPGRALAIMLQVLGPGPKWTGDSNIGAQVMAGIMNCHPGEIQELIAKMPDGPLKQLATGIMVSRICQSGGSNWIVRMPGGTGWERIDFVRSYTASERAFAAARVATYPGTGTATAINTRLFREYAQDDRENAMKLAESMPAGGTREHALAGVAGAIAKSDGIAAALAYLKDCPDTTRGLLLNDWASTVNDPAELLAQAARFADQPSGKDPIRKGFFSLREKDRAAADRWLEENPTLAPLVEGLH